MVKCTVLTNESIKLNNERTNNNNNNNKKKGKDREYIINPTPIPLFIPCIRGFRS